MGCHVFSFLYPANMEMPLVNMDQNSLSDELRDEGVIRVFTYPVPEPLNEQVKVIIVLVFMEENVQADTGLIRILLSIPQDASHQWINQNFGDLFHTINLD